MKDYDYKRLFMTNGYVPINYFTKEVDRLLSYHSYSPQYKMYSDFLIGGLDQCLYKGLINDKDAKVLIKRIENHKDTISGGLASSIMFLFDRYKPRLGVIDLLFDIDIDRTYCLKLLCSRMINSYERFNSFGSLFDKRRELIIINLEKALELKDSPNRECYYYLYLAKRLLIVSCCYYRAGEFDEMIDVYIDIAKEVYNVDKDFYNNYVMFYKKLDCIDDYEVDYPNPSYMFGDYEHESIVPNRIEPSNTFGGNSVGSSNYSYINLMMDLDLFMRDSSSYKYMPNINKYLDVVMSSDLPKYLKDKFSTQLYELEIEFKSESFEITEPFLWFDFVGEDFLSFIKLKCYNESKVVVSTINDLLTEDNLVEFYVNKAYVYAFANGDVDVYNYVLRENLDNLKNYNFIKDVDYYYNKYRR